MFYDGSVNPETPHCIDCHLIYGAGIGFGLGDETKLPLLSNGLTERVFILRAILTPYASLLSDI